MAPLIAAIVTALAILLVDLSARPAVRGVGTRWSAWRSRPRSRSRSACGRRRHGDRVRRRLPARRADDVPRPAVHLDRRADDRLRAGLPAPRGLPVAEFATVLVFAMTGAMLIAASTDLLLLFLGLELMVLPGYLLAGYHKTRRATRPRARSSTSSSARSARRSSCSGSAFVWGLTGTRGSTAVAAQLTQGRDAARVPLQPGPRDGLRLPDDRASRSRSPRCRSTTGRRTPTRARPTPVTGYLSVGPKVGAFALILRLFVEALGADEGRLAAGRGRPRRR